MADKKLEWWKEDADRLNKMTDLARKKKKIVPVGDKAIPELNKDGSLKNILKEKLKSIVSYLRNY